MSIDVLREFKEIITISLIVVVIKLLIYIKQTAKLNFRTMILNALIAFAVATLGGWIAKSAGLDSWIVNLITIFLAWAGAKVDDYIYKLVDIAIGAFKNKVDNLGKGEE